MAPVKTGATGSEGFFPIFNRKSGISEYLLRKYSDSPRPSATPLINAGGKIGGFFDRLQSRKLSLPGFLCVGSRDLIFTINFPGCETRRCF